MAAADVPHAAGPVRHLDAVRAFRVRDGGLVLDELVEGVSIDELKARTAAPFSTA